MQSFKDIFQNQDDYLKKSQQEVSAAEIILSSRVLKDKKFTLRINITTYSKFSKINKMLGMSNGSVINGFISRYIKENENILKQAEAEEAAAKDGKDEDEFLEE